MQKETAQLIKFMNYIDWQKKVIPELAAVFHVPNEGTRSIQRGRIMRQKGVRAGVFDVLCLFPRNGYHGLLIEFKVNPGKLSQAQKDWGTMMHGFGYCVKVAWSADEAIEILEKYLCA